MRIGGCYSFNNGVQYITEHFSSELEEIKRIIDEVDGYQHRTKVGKEKTNQGKMLFSPVQLNKSFKAGFGALNWARHREYCEYPTEFYLNGYVPQRSTRGAFREMDFVKNKLGVEVQLGKYAFMVYNVAAKMTIFRNLGVIEAGVEIVPLQELAKQMSSGVSYFEQFVWDLEHRGTADIDVPVMILGVTI